MSNASGSILLTAYQGQTEDALQLLLKLTKPGLQEEQRTEVWAELENKVGLVKPKDEADEIDRFTFDATEMTLAMWQREVAVQLGGGRTARMNVHWKIHGGVIYRNEKVESWTQDDKEEGLASRDELLARYADAGREQLENAWREAETRTRNHNRQAVLVEQVWTPLKREDTNDARHEDSLLIYKDDRQKELNWQTTINKIKSYGKEVGYSTAHYRSCLDRLVSYFTPNLSEIMAELQADEIAKYLMKRDSIDTTHDRKMQQLTNLVRVPTESIKVKMADLSAIAESIYKDDNEPEKSHNISRVMMEGMLNFTIGKTRDEVLQFIEQARTRRTPVDWKKLINAVAAAERTYGAPTTALKFNAPVQNTQRLFTVTPSVSTRTGHRPMTVQTRRPGTYRTDRSSTLTRNDRTEDDWKAKYLNLLKDAGAADTEPAALDPEPDQEQVEELGATGGDDDDLDETTRELDTTVMETPNRPNSSRRNDYSLRSSGGPTFAGELPVRTRTSKRPAALQDGEVEISRILTKIMQISQQTQDKPANERFGRLDSRNRSNDRQSRDRRPQSRESDRRPNFRSATPDRNRPSNARPNSPRPTNSDRRDARPRTPDRSNDRPRTPERPYNRRETPDRSYNRQRTPDYQSRDRRSSTPEGRTDRRFGSNNDRGRPTDRRSDSNRRPASRPRTPENSAGGNYGDRNRGRTPNREDRGNQDRSRTRERSYGKYDAEPGYNCSYDYDPSKMKHCSKCLTHGKHHEFACPDYERWTRTPCPKCKYGMHFSRGCKMQTEKSESRQNSPVRVKLTDFGLNSSA